MNCIGKAKLLLVLMLACGLVAASLVASGCGAPTVTVGTTETIAQSQMYKTLVDKFEKENNVTVTTKPYANSKEVLAAGAGGQVDALLVSKNAALEEWMKKGYAASADDVFYSNFVVVGPDADPAQIRGLDCPGKSCKKIGTAGQAFLTSGDGSDLDTKIMGYWKACGIDPVGQAWFTTTGKDVTETLSAADDKQAYTVVDTSTWLANEKNVNLKKLVEGCSMLMNQYSLVLIDPAKFPKEEVNAEGARKLSAFALGEEGQGAIGSYKEAGVVIYQPNATRQKTES